MYNSIIKKNVFSDTHMTLVLMLRNNIIKCYVINDKVIKNEYIIYIISGVINFNNKMEPFVTTWQQQQQQQQQIKSYIVLKSQENVNCKENNYIQVSEGY